MPPSYAPQPEAGQDAMLHRNLRAEIVRKAERWPAPPWKGKIGTL